ncbi:S8 family serine peptidase [Picrophilus oshimae]|uniref:Membrane associated serine protease n=1 Tax=Picrophilus torridus (strain ATCC 700027 / DSM 9790 / JCM 10055 / NBRC 100828 / KAW 2/3) TaxID=1122961 RepID=Q6L2N0_PICTO|nr:S8 family serine peptidase [Picrophilus oshimae]AAT42772.1 membrane associated serine protease [Picrophilus oshimae DSM 9789]
MRGIKIIAIIIICMFIITSMDVVIPSDNKMVNENNYNVKEDNKTIVSCIPQRYMSLVNSTLKNDNINYNYTGNIINVYNNSVSLSFFNKLNKYFGINYFIDNSSFEPYYMPALSTSGYLPSQIRYAYNINPVYNESIYGNGTTIVIVDAYGDPSINYDVSAFDNLTGLPAVNLTVLYPEGTVYQENSGWATETALDVEWAHAIAPGASIKLVVSPGSGTSLIDAVAYSIYHHLGNIISLSWGEPESEMGNSELKILNNIYKDAALNNITVVAASGDNGSYDTTSHLAVNFPASDPYVLGVGGVNLYFKNGEPVETAWGGIANGVSFGSGGGYSSYFKRPYYQDPEDYNNTHRGVPDVSMVAGRSTPVLIIVNGNAEAVGGTSVATPIWAGIIALMDQYMNRSMGFINPVLYQISNTKLYTNAFTQITSGTNGFYNAHAGWNPVTGLGTPIVSNLLNDTMIIESGYGSDLIFNNTYYSNNISATINITENKSVEIFNGSTYYYIGFYSNNGYAYFGIKYNGTYGYEYIIKNNNTLFKMERPAGDKSSYNLSVQIKKDNIYMYSGNRLIFNFTGIISFAGSSRAVIGTMQENNQINFVNIPQGEFSKINIFHNNTRINDNHYIDLRFSSLNNNYSTINITKKNSNFYSGYNLVPAKNTSKKQYFIEYNIIFDRNLIKIYTNTGIPDYYELNGKKSVSGYFVIDHGGYYNASALINGTLITRSIYIPDFREASLNVSYSPDYYNARINLTVDNYFHYKFTGRHINIYELNGTNYFVLKSNGYKTEYYNTTGNRLIMHRSYVYIKVFTFQANTTVKFDNITAYYNNGPWHYIKVLPQSGSIEIIKNGFYNISVRLIPGKNYTTQVLIKNTSRYYLYLYVYNKYLDYALSNAVIYVNGTVAGYTNGSGVSILYLKGDHYITVSDDEYINASFSIDMVNNADQSIGMIPSFQITPTILFQITHYVPFLFYFVYMSWSPYSLKEVSYYKVEYSTSPFMSNPKTLNISSSDTSAFLSGIVPGKTYYVSVYAYTPSGAFVSTPEIKIVYNPLYIILNVIIVLGIIFYIYIFVRFLMRRKNRYDEF